MSKSSIDDYLNPYKARYRRHWNSGAKSGRYIKTQIPIKSLDYNVTGIGHVEADTVHHCGGSLSDIYALTLTVRDVFTSWTEMSGDVGGIDVWRNRMRKQKILSPKYSET